MDRTLDKIAERLRAIVAEGEAGHPVDLEAILTEARRVEAQAEMIREKIEQ
jgi:hypothetical protein